MESVGTVLDLGCGIELLDLEWWATRTTRDEDPVPLNITGHGVNLGDKPARKVPGVSYSKKDISDWQSSKKKYDVLWCHDVFQYLLNPYQALANWWHLANPNAMLILSFPQTVEVKNNVQEYDLPLGHHYHHTVVSLIRMLACAGWDCREGFFQKKPSDVWLNAIVYRSDAEPQNPLETTWYDLEEKQLIPETAELSLQRYGRVRQRDLVLPWLDKSIAWMEQQ